MQKSILSLFIFLFIILFSYPAFCEIPDEIEEQNKNAEFMPDTLSSSITDDLLAYAKEFIGVRYKYGGSSPQGFDCSGFTQYVFKKINYNLPRSSARQGETGDLVKPDDFKPGDLVFFMGSRNVPGRVGHVGIIVNVKGPNDFDFIHAYTKKGITIQNISERKKGYLFVKRIIQQ